MARIWRHTGSSWVRLELAGGFLGIPLSPARRPRPMASLPSRGVAAVVGQYEGPGRSTIWVLLDPATANVRLNGQLLVAGLAVLRDRDEILVSGRAPLYFSTEELAKIVPFPGSAEPVFCARCRQPIQAGTPAVRCPSCGHWSEQSETKPCWTYGPFCPMCEQPTALGTALRWTPDEP